MAEQHRILPTVEEGKPMYAVRAQAMADLPVRREGPRPQHQSHTTSRSHLYL